METTSANESDVDHLVPLLDQERALFSKKKRPIRQATADKAYVGRAEQLNARNILDYTIPRANMKQKRAPNPVLPGILRLRQASGLQISGDDTGHHYSESIFFY